MEESPYYDYDMIICEGSIRSGKTVAMIDSFITWSLDNFCNENFILAGKSMGALKRNVIEPFRQILTAKGIGHNYVRSENPRIEIGGNTYYLFGANNEASQDVLQGLTAAGALLDEAALMPRSFVEQAIGRCSVEGSKVWMNCNPQGPYHYLKTDYIDKSKEKMILHLHFILEDNLTLSQKIIDRFKRMFTGVFYQRNILGLWVLAEGIIYDMFDKEKHLIKSEEEQRKILNQINRFYVANDYGTGTVFVLGLFGITGDKKTYLIKSFYYDAKKVGKQKADIEYADDLKKFIKGYKVSRIIIPDDALSFIRECRNQKIGSIKKFYRDPGTVLDGIRLQANMLSTNNYKIFDNPSNRPIIDEYYSYVWDEKAQERGEDKPIKKNDHGKDMERYFHLTVQSGSSFLT